MQSGNSDYLVVDDHVNNLTRFINGFLRLSRDYRNEFILDTCSGGGAEGKGNGERLKWVFKIYKEECFVPFIRNIINNDHYDSHWICPLTSFLTALLTKWAVLADSEGHASAIMAQGNLDGVDNPEEFADLPKEHLEEAQMELNKIF